MILDLGIKKETTLHILLVTECSDISKTSKVAELDSLMIKITQTALKRKYVIY